MCQIEKCTHTYTQIVRQGETRGCQHRNVARWNQEDDSPSVSWNWTTWKLPWLPVEEEKGGEERRRSSKTTWPWACKQERGHNGVCASVMCVPLCMIRQAILLSAILLVTVAYREKKKKKSNLIHYYLPPRKKKEMSKFLRLSKHLRFNIVRDIMVVTLKKKNNFYLLTEIVSADGRFSLTWLQFVGFWIKIWFTLQVHLTWVVDLSGSQSECTWMPGEALREVQFVWRRLHIGYSTYYICGIHSIYCVLNVASGTWRAREELEKNGREWHPPAKY